MTIRINAIVNAYWYMNPRDFMLVLIARTAKKTKNSSARNSSIWAGKYYVLKVRAYRNKEFCFFHSSVFKHFISTVTEGWLTTIVSPTVLDASHSSRVTLEKRGIKSLSLTSLSSLVITRNKVQYIRWDTPLCWNRSINGFAKFQSYVTLARL